MVPVFLLFHAIFYLCVFLWVNCQFFGYDTEFLAAQTKYISRFGLHNCDMYMSYN